MTEPPRRRILTLKAVPPKPAPPPQWKCKPCGAVFEVADALSDDEVIRCASCNARLGLAGAFRETGDAPRVRARKIST